MILVNGSPASGVEAADRGLHYGDGLFETMAVLGRERSLNRLSLALRKLGAQASAQ